MFFFSQRYSVICIRYPEIGDTHHLISLKFIEGHLTSRIKRGFRPQLYTRICDCFVFIFQRATVCFSKGKKAS